MELHGKVISPNKGLNLNSEPEVLVNTKSGRITLSKAVMSKLGESVAVGFGYDAQETQGSRSFLYIVEDGCAVGKGGSVSSKFHSSKLKEMYKSAEGMEDATTRFKLNIDMENTVDYEGTSLYPITFQTVLADLTRTKSTVTETETDATPTLADNVNEEPVVFQTENTEEQPTDALSGEVVESPEEVTDELVQD